MTSTTNFYKYVKHDKPQVNPNYGKTHMFKVPFRACIVASSGSGKTNTMLDIVKKMGPTFLKIILCIPEPDEPLYNLLKESLGDKMEIYTGDVKAGKTGKKIAPNVPKLDCIAKEDSDGWVPTLLIADDLMLYEDQSVLETYWVRGRKKNISMVYISQSFYKIPITIRRNTQYFILKRNVLESDLKKIFKITCFDMSFNQFMNHYREATSNMHDFLLIDTENSALYRNFDTQPLFCNHHQKEEARPKGDDEDVKEAGPTEGRPNEVRPSETRRPSEGYDNYQNNTFKTMGIEAYIQWLQTQRTGQYAHTRDVYDRYLQFVEANNYPKADIRIVGRLLVSTFPKHRSGSNIYYLI